MRSLTRRVENLEAVIPGDFVEVMPIEHFYGDPTAKPQRIPRREFNTRTLESFYGAASSDSKLPG
ncbi:hypothetical protein [Paraburkholderia phosphatilytica]|uniref:hypothetical protein n=1 Tax=Paraburkholderia phosphatilytica TaxID=2282883 RepID=UPI000E53012D|nr:hypothetical protein [Paraburkholderia phosphatilytica]